MNKKNKDGHPEIAPLEFSGTLAKTVFDSLSANIAIIDGKGVILETNQAWRNYANVNQMEGANDSIGVNYLELCDATTGKEAKDARRVAAGIRSVIKDDIPRGSILMLATDGVWETRNASGQMFGRRAIYDIIRKNSMAGADNIIKAIFEQISKFRKGAEPEDDITLVVLKFL
jgi:hypothetical protein